MKKKVTNTQSQQNFENKDKKDKYACLQLQIKK